MWRPIPSGSRRDFAITITIKFGKAPVRCWLANSCFTCFKTLVRLGMTICQLPVKLIGALMVFSDVALVTTVPWYGHVVPLA